MEIYRNTEYTKAIRLRCPKCGGKAFVMKSGDLLEFVCNKRCFRITGDYELLKSIVGR